MSSSDIGVALELLPPSWALRVWRHEISLLGYWQAMHSLHKHIGLASLKTTSNVPSAHLKLLM